MAFGSEMKDHREGKEKDDCALPVGRYGRWGWRVGAWCVRVLLFACMCAFFWKDPPWECRGTLS